MLATGFEIMGSKFSVLELYAMTSFDSHEHELLSAALHALYCRMQTPEMSPHIRKMQITKVSLFVPASITAPVRRAAFLKFFLTSNRSIVRSIHIKQRSSIASRSNSHSFPLSLQARSRMSSPGVSEKTCKTCGRRITWRKKWERCWDEIKYCSDKCRKSKGSMVDQELEQAILDTLADRKVGATVCPSEIARSYFPGEQWRSEMERVRQAARRLVADGRIVITQRGQVVDPSTARGPIRLRLT